MKKLLLCSVALIALYSCEKEEPKKEDPLGLKGSVYIGRYYFPTNPTNDSTITTLKFFSDDSGYIHSFQYFRDRPDYEQGHNFAYKLNGTRKIVQLYDRFSNDFMPGFYYFTDSLQQIIIVNGEPIGTTNKYYKQ